MSGGIDATPVRWRLPWYVGQSPASEPGSDLVEAAATAVLAPDEVVGGAAHAVTVSARAGVRRRRASRVMYEVCAAPGPDGERVWLPAARDTQDDEHSGNKGTPDGAAAVMTTTPEKIVYTARATSIGGRSGRATSDDGIIDVALTAPAELGGPGTGTNPEQLFAAGYSACFQGALLMVSKAKGVDTSDSRVTAEIGFGPEGKSYGITADLKVAVPGVDLATVQELADAAHEVCPYSKATRGNIPVTVTAVEA